MSEKSSSPSATKTEDSSTEHASMQLVPLRPQEDSTFVEKAPGIAENSAATPKRVRYVAKATDTSKRRKARTKKVEEEQEQEAVKDGPATIQSEALAGMNVVRVSSEIPGIGWVIEGPGTTPLMLPFASMPNHDQHRLQENTIFQQQFWSYSPSNGNECGAFPGFPPPFMHLPTNLNYYNVYSEQYSGTFSNHYQQAEVWEVNGTVPKRTYQAEFGSEYRTLD